MSAQEVASDTMMPEERIEELSDSEGPGRGALTPMEKVVEPIQPLTLDEQTAQAERRRSELKKEVRLRNLKASIEQLQEQTQKPSKPLNPTGSSKEPVMRGAINPRSDDDVEMTSSQSVPVVVYRRRAARPEKVSPYHGKTVKEHLDYERNCRVAFRVEKRTSQMMNPRSLSQCNRWKGSLRKLGIDMRQTVKCKIIPSKST